MKEKIYIVGLTGGIGSGKSTVAEEFRRLGIVVVDADAASRAVVKPGMPALSKIAARFGADILYKDGSLDRAALREIIFLDTNQKRWLEVLLHPPIREWIIGQLYSADSAYVILESPLLFETDQHQLVDSVLLVDFPVDLQILRTSARDGNNAVQVQRIIKSQMPREKKIKKADWIFDNALSKDTMMSRIGRLHQEFLTQSIPRSSR